MHLATGSKSSPAQSNFAPDSFTTLAERAFSSRMQAANDSGVPARFGSLRRDPLLHLLHVQDARQIAHSVWR